MGRSGPATLLSLQPRAVALAQLASPRVGKCTLDATSRVSLTPASTLVLYAQRSSRQSATGKPSSRA